MYQPAMCIESSTATPSASSCRTLHDVPTCTLHTLRLANGCGVITLWVITLHIRTLTHNVLGDVTAALEPPPKSSRLLSQPLSPPLSQPLTLHTEPLAPLAHPALGLLCDESQR